MGLGRPLFAGRMDVLYIFFNQTYELDRRFRAIFGLEDSRIHSEGPAYAGLESPPLS
jgi:hypothetical protein